MPVATGPLSGDRNCAKIQSRRTPRRAVASDARPSRARERRDRRGLTQPAPVRASFRFASRARAVRRLPNIGQQRSSRFKLQIEAEEKDTARARKGARGEAQSLISRLNARQIAASRRDVVAPARRERGLASCASRGPARGRVAQRYATRDGSSAQIPALSRVCRIATRAPGSITPAAPCHAQRELWGIREGDAPL